jgi:asparagine synthetase B (glutamine-hydrolysing)
VCGIFGSVKLAADTQLPRFENFLRAGKMSERRGKDASGMVVSNSQGNYILKHPQRFTQLIEHQRKKFIRQARSDSKNDDVSW